MADGRGHGGANAEGSEEHDCAGELEHDFGEAFEKREDGIVRFATNLREGDAEDDGEEDDLKDVVLGGGFEETARGEVFDDGGESDAGGGDFLGGVLGRRELNPAAGLNERGRAPTDEEGECGDSLEVDEGFESDAANGFEVVAVAGDADDER